jgi:hypothetical protein
MTREEQINLVLFSLAEVQVCGACGVRLRFGDMECPRCGADIEDLLRLWAGHLLDDLAGLPRAVRPVAPSDKGQSRKDS